MVLEDFLCNFEVELVEVIRVGNKFFFIDGIYLESMIGGFIGLEKRGRRGKREEEEFSVEV